MATNLKDVIKTLVRQEIKMVIGEHDDLIKEMVKSSLLPELKAAVHESVCKALGELQGEHSEIEENQPVVHPSPGLGHRTSDIRPQTTGPGNPNSALRAPHYAFGRYLYCIADASEKATLGNIGIEENAVYSIPYNDFSAIVHNCPARPYQSENPEIVKGWVITHQKVVDAAWDRFGTVIPIGFDTILQGDADADPETNMKRWLQDDYDHLKGKMKKVRGKAEFGVQVFWDKRMGTQKIADESPEVNALRREIESKPRGIAYMYRQKLETLLHQEIESRMDRYFREFYERIALHATDIRVEKTRKAEDEGKQMLLNLSCLLPRDGSHELGEELEKINALEDFSVRYTGPWPPYSFV